MAIQLPVVPSLPNYTFQTVIMDRPYQFRFRWNARDASWYFDVSEGDGTSILRGVKVVLGGLLGRESNHELFRDCGLFAIDTSGTGAEAGLDDLGTRVLIAHFDPGDLDLSRSPPLDIPKLEA